MSRCHAAGSPSATVRVMSAWYPPYRAPQSIVIRSPAANGRSPGAWCGIAPFGPLATMESKAGASAPRSIIVRSSRTANSRSVRPGTMSRSAAENASSVIAHARASSAISVSSFTIRSSSTSRPSGTRTGPSSSAASSACRSTVISWASNATVASPLAAARRARAGSMKRSVTSSRSGQSRRAASSYRESVASTPGPPAGSSSAALELTSPVR